MFEEESGQMRKLVNTKLDIYFVVLYFFVFFVFLYFCIMYFVFCIFVSNILYLVFLYLLRKWLEEENTKLDIPQLPTTTFHTLLML